jgi:hypothetical protein
MSSRMLQRAISCLLVAVFPLATFAADTGVAVVYPNRSVNLNGNTLDRSQAVVEGDNLRTAGSGATIALNGATLQMGTQSEVVFHTAGARVMTGSLAITTTRGLGAEVVNLRVEPATSGARYMISEEGSKLIIAAMEGAVRVSDGKQTVVVDQDKALVSKLEPLAIATDQAQSTPGNSQSGQSQDNDRKKRGAGGAIPAAGVGVTLSKSTLMAIAAAAAVGGAVAVYLLTNRAPASGTH